MINQEQLSLNLLAIIREKEFFLNKQLLKGTQGSITESLIAKKMRILKKAREKHQFWNVWTTDGKILYKDRNDNKFNFTMVNLIFNVVVNVSFFQFIWVG